MDYWHIMMPLLLIERGMASRETSHRIAPPQHIPDTLTQYMMPLSRTSDQPSRIIACGALAVGLVVAATAGILFVPAHAQQSDTSKGVFYTCIDATGRKITSDRPIVSCMDREQRMLSDQGILLKVIPPELTGAQRAAQQAKERQEALQAQLAQQTKLEQQRFDEALLIRYPTRAAHETNRYSALALPQSLLLGAKQQLASLNENRTNLAGQMAAYQKNPDKAPGKLKRDISSNTQSIEAQQRLIAGYQAEIKRINTQFDAEDKRLQPMWQKWLTPSVPAAAE